MLLSDLQMRRRAVDARVVYEDVDPSEGFVGLVDHGCPIGCLRHIHAQRKCASARLLDRFSGTRRGGLVQVRDDYFRAQRRQLQCDGATNSSSCSSNNRHLPFELHRLYLLRCQAYTAILGVRPTGRVRLCDFLEFAD